MPSKEEARFDCKTWMPQRPEVGLVACLWERLRVGVWVGAAAAGDGVAADWYVGGLWAWFGLGGSWRRARARKRVRSCVVRLGCLPRWDMIADWKVDGRAVFFLGGWI